MAGSHAAKGPDLTAGVPLADIPAEGVFAGRVGEDAVIVARLGGEIVALGAHCTHYGGPLAQGLRVGDTVRCPWHHACFSLRTGEALAAPAFASLDRWKVEVKKDRVFVQRKDRPAKSPERTLKRRHPIRIVIVGGGAAGFAAAEMLRRLDYRGELTMLSDDADAPYDRPNLSKDYLAGNAPEDWIPLRDDAFYRDHKIALRLSTKVASLDPGARKIALESGERIAYEALLLATGAEPIRPPAPGFDQPHVHTLRSLKDSRALIAASQSAKKAVVIGASFIGLECAASLRKRGLEVDVVAPEAVPMLKVLGADFGGFVRSLHEQNGVRFHLGRSVGGVQDRTVHLDDGSTLEADLVVLGVGVRPRVDLAKAAGLVVDNGVDVDDRLRTSAQDIWAAGDIAAYPDPISGAASGSSTGSPPSARARPPPPTCWAPTARSANRRSSGAPTTTPKFATSGRPRAGIRLSWTAIPPNGTAKSAISRTAGSWLRRRSGGTWRRWSRPRPSNGRPPKRGRPQPLTR